MQSSGGAVETAERAAIVTVGAATSEFHEGRFDAQFTAVPTAPTRRSRTCQTCCVRTVVSGPPSAGSRSESSSTAVTSRSQVSRNAT